MARKIVITCDRCGASSTKETGEPGWPKGWLVLASFELCVECALAFQAWLDAGAKK